MSEQVVLCIGVEKDGVLVDSKTLSSSAFIVIEMPESDGTPMTHFFGDSIDAHCMVIAAMQAVLMTLDHRRDEFKNFLKVRRAYAKGLKYGLSKLTKDFGKTHGV